MQAATPSRALRGVIPGRFQVLHHDHLRYLLAAHQLCGHLIVGITNPDPSLSREDGADPNRTRPLANPLTYFERYQLVRAVLEAAGCPAASFSIVPLPISFPQLYRHYVPLDALFFVSIYDDWGRRKLEFFKQMHLETHVLWEVAPQDKGISAQHVRDLMLQDAPWQHLVPPESARLLQQWGVPGRLKAMAAGRQHENVNTSDERTCHE